MKLTKLQIIAAARLINEETDKTFQEREDLLHNVVLEETEDGGITMNGVALPNHASNYKFQRELLQLERKYSQADHVNFMTATAAATTVSELVHKYTLVSTNGDVVTSAKTHLQVTPTGVSLIVTLYSMTKPVTLK
ncbi:hypothetical protein [Achromobacter phage Motura]|uniref:Uncharacterized protein n=1 Tax=Achromobacter phage Motura TaxID=2591403 RepID=A0A514CSE7_9CAUD|nr:hypothetical protein H1O15_gp068 [Achromobacter phage Motura]QDH83394.1 hypothetical protein [Achromobacter phage Motura]